MSNSFLESQSSIKIARILSFRNIHQQEFGNSSENIEYDETNCRDIRKRTLLMKFVRMSSMAKIDLITTFFKQIRNFEFLTVLMRIFFPANSKLMFYSKIETDSNCLANQFLLDHNRALDDTMLNSTLKEDITWFNMLPDSEKLDIVISLLISAGGNIIGKMHWRFRKIINERIFHHGNNLEKYTSRTSMIFPVYDNENEEPLITLSEYKPKYSASEGDAMFDHNCPSHKKVVESRKQWQAQIAKFRREMEADIAIMNEPILRRRQEQEKIKNADTKAGKKARKQPKTRENMKKSMEEIDWIQLLPIWIVKRIFSYFNDKELQKLKAVNNYWSVMCKEVIAEQHARVHLDATIKSSQVLLDNLLNMPITRTDLDIDKDLIATEPKGYRKRIEKQRRTGATLKRYEPTAEFLHHQSLLTEGLKQMDTDDPCLPMVKQFPIGTGLMTCGEARASHKDLQSLFNESAVFSLYELIGDDISLDSSSSNELLHPPAIIASPDLMDSW